MIFLNLQILCASSYMTETEQERANSGVIRIPNGSHMSWVLPEKYLSLVE